MITIEEVLHQKKNNQVYFVNPDTTVFDALQQMAIKDVGSLLVLENGKLVGIFTERDYARKIILCDKCSKDTPVKEIMTSNPVVVSPEKTIEDAEALMSQYRIRHLPVLSGDTVLGMLSIRDLVEAYVKRQEQHIEKLTEYISGSDYGH
jgi:CBS domain-containing protein